MNREQIKNDMLALAAIGQDETGGIDRVFGSSFIAEIQSAISSYMEGAGLQTWIDSVGNVHGLYAPEGAEGKEILTGSHLDTVKGGGVFDGLLGIVGAVESVRQIRAENLPLRSPIHVIATNGEEGNDLGGTFGSRAMMGLLDTEDTVYLNRAAAFGYTKEALEAATLPTEQAKCWLELHIEQGKTLDLEQKKIGIVTGIVGLQRYEIRVVGEANHSGTTMMEHRRDALVAASKIVIEADRLARSYGEQTVATVGRMEILPNSVAVIPGEVQMILECRCLDENRMERFFSEIKDRIAVLVPEVKVQMKPMVKKSPVHCDQVLMDAIEEACKTGEMAYRRMSSGATHDGNAMALKMPIGMIFVPSIDGISHSRLERTEWEDVFQGIEVLCRTIRTLAV